MKRWGRVVIGFALLLCVSWGVRAAYLFRVWQVVQVWAGLPDVMPTTSAFFAPDTWATSRHGAYADIVFLRVGMGKRAGAFASAWNALPPATPNPPGNGCDAAEWRRNAPSQIAPEAIAPCYRVAKPFGTPTATAHSVAIGTAENGRGGTAWLDDAGTLHLAVYRMR